MKYFKQLVVILFFGFLFTLWSTAAFADTVVPQASHHWYDGIVGFVSDVMTLNNPVQLKNPQEGFPVAKEPTFTLTIPTQTKNKIGKSSSNVWKTKQESITAAIVAQDGTIYPTVIKKSSAGTFMLSFASVKELPHGSFTLKVAAQETSFYTRNITQDFSWGVIAINTNKSMYTPGEKAHLSFGILNDTGGTICNAKITATITDPSGNVTLLSTADKTIQKTTDCGSVFYTTTPDYEAFYQTKNVGTYHIHIVADNHNGSHTLDDTFVVKSSVPFSVDRTNFPTRIFPAVPYPVKFTVVANQNYEGNVTEYVPKTAYVENISNGGTAPENIKLEDVVYNTDPAVLAQDAQAFAKYNGHISKLVHELIPVITKDKNGKMVTTYETPTYENVDTSLMPVIWHVRWQKGHTYTLSYTLNFPFVSPGFYVLGPLKIGNVFTETRQWQIASDAVFCWVGTNGGTWSGSNWVATTGTTLTTLPTSATATFDPTTTSCTGGVATNNNSSIDASWGGTVASINITSNYTGTITQAHAITMSGTFTQAAGTFTGGSQNITINSTSGTVAFQQTGGTFTSTSGTLTVKGGFKISGGTFNANGGSVVFSDGAASITINATATFNNLNIGNGICASGNTVTFSTGQTVTISGTLTLDSNCNQNQLSGTGTINAKGNISLLDNGWGGSAVITINGTGSQTISGDGINGDLDQLPSITINKLSGTLSITNTIFPTENWTYTTGAISPGTSTVEFYLPNVQTNTISGTYTLANVILEANCQQGGWTLSSGTMTVTGTLTIDSVQGCNGDTLTGPGGINAQGNVNVTGRGINGTAVITLNGSSAQTLSGDGVNGDMNQVPGITINSSSTVTISNTIEVTGNWTYTSGTLSTGSSVVDFALLDGGSASITGTQTLGNVTFDAGCTNGNTETISTGTTLTITGTLTLTDTSCSNTMSINGSGTINAQGNVASSNDGIKGNVAITFGGGSNQTITLSGTNFPTGNVTINKSGGSASLGGNVSFNSSGQTLTISSGTLDLAGHNLTVNSSLTVNSGGTLKLQGTETITTGSTAFNTGSTVTYYGSGTYTSLVLGNTYYNLNISGTGSYTPNAAVTVNGSFTQGSGTFVAPTNMNIGGNLTLSGGTFTQGTGTVTFIDNTQTSTIGGSYTFYNLTSITAGKTIDFTAGSTTTITNTLALRGNSTSTISLRSTSTGTQWNIVPQGSIFISYADIEDSNTCSAPAAPISASSSTNSGDNSCWNFPGNAWYNSNWQYRMRIVINHTKVTADQTNFPVLISWTSNSSVASDAQHSGNDILFTDISGVSILPFEIENYNFTTGELEAWVQVPSLSSTVDTTLYMYFGNASATSQQNKTAVWDSNYMLVEHLGETTGTTTFDSTSNAANGTKVSSTSPNPAAGQIDGAQSFNGTSDYISRTSSPYTGTTNWTLEGWIYPSALNQNNLAFYVGNDNGGYGFGIGNAANGTGNHLQGLFGGVNYIDSNYVFSSTNTWYHVVMENNGTTTSFYVNGTLQSGTSTATPLTPASRYAIGMEFNGTNTPFRYFSGRIDEVRFSNIARSASWIQTEYNNQSSPSTFISTFPITNPPSVQIQGGVKFIGGSKLKAN